ncbi:Protein translocase subunit SecF [Candidatus Magnetomoraceae bacterium gMMP-15]
MGFAASLVLILISIISLLAHGGPKYGIDFAGGSLIQVKFESQISPDSIKSALKPLNLHTSSVQQFGEARNNEYLIRADINPEKAKGLGERVRNALSGEAGRDVKIRRVEMVGPQVGKDLREKALKAMFYALLFITVYISGRFELKWMLSGGIAAILIGAVYFFSIFNVSIPVLIAVSAIVALILFWRMRLKYAMGAIVALIHDVTITVGIFSLFDKEFTLPIIAALLTIIGYSLNDTIIVFDRIRENSRKSHKLTLEKVINTSINETLSRTILTSITTLIVLIALFVLGGNIIHDFAFAMIVGVFIGTYSSIFVASPILSAWKGR